MKHNPRANEVAAAIPGFAGLHPLQPEAQAQGALRVMHELQGFLSEICGLPAVSLQPMAGAQGELTSILMVKKFFEDAGDDAQDDRPGAFDRARDQPGDGHDGRTSRAVEIGLDEHGVRGRRGAQGDGRRDHRGAHDHEPQHLRRLRAEHKGDLRDPARGRRLPVHGRREHEREPRPHAPRRGRRGRHALQPPQDVLDPPRRRRPRLRRHRLLRGARPVPPRPGGREGRRPPTPSSGPRRASGGWPGSTATSARCS